MVKGSVSDSYKVPATGAWCLRGTSLGRYAAVGERRPVSLSSDVCCEEGACRPVRSGRRSGRNNGSNMHVRSETAVTVEGAVA